MIVAPAAGAVMENSPLEHPAKIDKPAKSNGVRIGASLQTV